MTSSLTRRVVWIVVLLGLAPLGCAPSKPRNVIIFIGDGMGPEQVRAARLYNGGPLALELFAHRGTMSTYSADNPITDSAASATAMATGHKVNNGVISTAIPANGRYPKGAPMRTTLEKLKARGKSTGLVTSTFVTDATPAGFGAHAVKRGRLAEIAEEYLANTRPNILLGGGGAGMTPEKARAAGYLVVTTRQELAAVIDGKTVPFVCGQFGPGHMPLEHESPEEYLTLPHLSEATLAALNLLDNDPDGFFLMVEGGRVDHACHANKLQAAIAETLEFNRAVEAALKWAAGRDDTLIIVTADHETGGLGVEKDNGPGQYPAVSWAGKSHTATEVPIAAWGFGAHAVGPRMDNTHVHELALDPKGFARWGKARCWPAPPPVKPATTRPAAPAATSTP